METKKQIKERLQAAGKWQAFLGLRDHLVAQGLAAAEARRQALEEVEVEHLEQRPPHPASGDHAPDRGVGTTTTTEANELDFTRHIGNADVLAWVAAHLADPEVKPVDSPNSTAWSLLCWARRSPTNESNFWSMWGRALPAARKQQTADATYDPDEDQGTARVMELLAEEWEEVERALAIVRGNRSPGPPETGHA